MISTVLLVLQFYVVAEVGCVVRPSLVRCWVNVFAITRFFLVGFFYNVRKAGNLFCGMERRFTGFDQCKSFGAGKTNSSSDSGWSSVTHRRLPTRNCGSEMASKLSRLVWVEQTYSLFLRRPRCPYLMKPDLAPYLCGDGILKTMLRLPLLTHYFPALRTKS